MNKNNVFGVGILLIILMVIGGLIVKVFVLDKDKTNENKDDSNITKEEESKNVSLEKDGYLFNAEYKSENLWSYYISGTKPSPCHETKHEAIVMESYPEQVTVNLSVIAPSPDVNCIQVLEDFKVDGEFSASKDANVSFSVL